MLSKQSMRRGQTGEMHRNEKTRKPLDRENLENREKTKKTEKTRKPQPTSNLPYRALSFFLAELYHNGSCCLSRRYTCVQAAFCFAVSVEAVWADP